MSYVIAILVILAAALAGTLWVGLSKENQRADGNYDRKTGAKTRTRNLVLFYIIFTVLLIIIFVMFARS